MSEERRIPFLYWLVVVVCLVVGVLGIFSIGAPFLVLGLTLIFLAPVRHDPRTFAPGVIGVLFCILGYVLVSPIGCTTTGTFTDGAGGSKPQSHTVCSNVLGIDYSGSGGYNPPRWPAVVAGLILGAGAFLLGRVLVDRSQARDPVG